MKPLQEFAIPVSGLKEGVHNYQFSLDWFFFKQFEMSPIQQGNFDVAVTFEKRPDLYILDIRLHGSMDTECDRCLADIHLPVNGEYRLLAKFDDDGEEDAEVVFVDRKMTSWNIARYIYEFVVLSIPIVKIYNCQDTDNPPCDREMLKRLQNIEQNSENDQSVWDILNDLETLKD